MADRTVAADAKDQDGAVPVNPEITEIEDAKEREQTVPTACVGDVAAVASKKDVEEIGPGKVSAFSAEAPAFVPGALLWADKAHAKGSDGGEESNFLARLPPSHRTLLRQGYHAMTGEWVAYHVGQLKSFNSRTGYGFIECAQSYRDYGADVFIHKNSMINPWHVGQPVEFAVICNGRGQPQATDVNWLPRLPAMAKSSSGMPTVAAPATADASVADASNKNPLEPLATSGGEDGGAVVSSAAGAQPVAASRTTAVSAVTGADPVAGSAQGSTQAQELLSATSQEASRNASGSSEPRHLGTLKSFSPAQGYGFFVCEEVFSNYQRDVYFDKSQLPSNNWHFGQTVEFMVIHNARGHPQARDIDWDPVPNLPNLQQANQPGTAGLLSGSTSSSGVGPNPQIHSAQTLGNLRKLLRHLHESQPETAVVRAMNFQGHSNADGGSDVEVDPNTDYVTFVLDRMGPEAEAVPKIKDFVKMLLLLMLAKMLRRQNRPSRCQQNIRWFEALSQTIEPAVESVREHFQSVVEQINNQLQNAHKENQMLRDDAQLPVLQAAFKRLQAKSIGLQSPSSGA